MEKGATTGTDKMSSSLILEFRTSTHPLKEGRFGKQEKKSPLSKVTHAEVLWNSLVYFQSASPPLPRTFVTSCNTNLQNGLEKFK